MIRQYFRMKKAEWQVKGMFYGTILSVVNEHEDAIETLKNLWESVKGKSGDELRTEFIMALAAIIHEENQKNSEEFEEE